MIHQELGGLQVSEKAEKMSVIEAVATVYGALERLTEDERQRVLRSAMALLGAGDLSTVQQVPLQKRAGPPPVTPVHAGTGLPTATPRVDIRTLRETKDPRSAVDMAVLTAYYLANAADEREHKDAIDKADIIKYFKQAGYPLPKSSPMTLVHTRNAGYFDSVGEGTYRLNPVGYNLAVHGLPRTAAKKGQKSARKPPRTGKKKSATKAVKAARQTGKAAKTSKKK